MKLTSLQQHLRHAFVGLVMGYVLSRVGFSSFTEVHKMFVFADLRLLFAFAGGVAIALIVFKFFTDGSAAPHKILHRGIIPGSVLFGIGWALTGACPSVALVQLGEGRLAAVGTIVGIASGIGLYWFARARYFRWDTGACE